MDDLALLRELSDNPELYLNDEDREQLQLNKELLDVSKANSITLYGSDIQKNMAELSEMMIKSIGETNVDEISETIDKTVEYLSESDDEEEKKSFLPWIKKSRSKRSSKVSLTIFLCFHLSSYFLIFYFFKFIFEYFFYFFFF